MKRELVHELTATFEGHAQQTEAGVEFWLARDLQHLLGYTEWRNFGQVLVKAKTACEVSKHRIADHFVDVTKMVDLGWPEALRRAEDVKKVERRLAAEDKKALKNPDGLES
jgi:DNA-damage-inducible protein D